MKTTKRLLLTIAMLALASCASFPNAQQNASADHGPYPANYKEIVHNYIAKTFKDPYSVRDLEINKPTKGWFTGARIFGEPSAYYGWEVIFTVNAKNSFGAYTGRQQIDLLVRDGQVIKVMNLTHPELTGGDINRAVPPP
jgi:hypothetical protein